MFVSMQMQSLLSKKLISAGHDRSDGGLLVTVLEMAFAGNWSVLHRVLCCTVFVTCLGHLIALHALHLHQTQRR